MKSFPTLRFVDVSGKVIDIEPHEADRFTVEPLGFAQLLEAAPEQRPIFRVVIPNARADAAATGLSAEGPVKVEATIQGDEPVVAYD